MKFAAQHVSFQEADGVFIFALGDKPGRPGEEIPEKSVILQFGGVEGDQERALGLTGLHIETSEDVHGYGKVEHIAYDGRTVSIIGRKGAVDIEAVIATEMMTPDAIRAAVEQCNQANATRPEA